MTISADVLRSFSGKNVLVTGGTGMIGRQVVNLLDQAGAHIRIVSLDRLIVNNHAEHIFGDLTDFQFCQAMAKDMDYVFHIAGLGASVKAIQERIASPFVSLLMMSVNMLEACRRQRVQKVVFTSSIGAYAPGEVFKESEYRLDSIPMDFAAWAKRMAETQIYAYQVQYGLNNMAIVRPANVYGPGDNFHPENGLVIPSLMYRIYHKENPLVVWGNGSAVRDFVFSRDIAEGIILALYHGTDAKFVNLGSGQPCSVKILVETLREFLDFEYVFDTTKPTGVKKRVMDITLAQKSIHYRPTTSLKEGLQQTWQWFIKNTEEHLKKKNYFAEEVV